jgi:hypothetical protein
MIDIRNERWAEPAEVFLPTPRDLGHVASEICQTALTDAKEQLHPLLRNLEPHHLKKRREFVQAFKFALERQIAQKLATWQPSVLAVFKFDESWMEARQAWDGSIHLLVKVPRLSNTLTGLGRKLDQSLTQALQQLGWSRFRARQSVLDVQQVTPNEMRHGVSYGAMFYAVHSVPVKVWSSKRTR